MDIKAIVEKAMAYDDLIESLKKVETKEDNEEKHLKGYMFDSLVYRFKIYQEKAFQLDVIDYKYKYNCSESEARYKVRDMYNRDMLRFIDILHEAIGEHD